MPTGGGIESGQRTAHNEHLVPSSGRTTSKPKRAPCHSVLTAALAAIGLPVLVYQFAVHTSWGPVLWIFSWSRTEGVHLTDVVVLLLVLPFWLLALAHLAICIRRGAGTQRGYK